MSKLLDQLLQQGDREALRRIKQEEISVNRVIDYYQEQVRSNYRETEISGKYKEANKKILEEYFHTRKKIKKIKIELSNKFVA